MFSHGNGEKCTDDISLKYIIQILQCFMAFYFKEIISIMFAVTT